MKVYVITPKAYDNTDRKPEFKTVVVIDDDMLEKVKEKYHVEVVKLPQKKTTSKNANE